MDEKYDFVILGSGLKECILSGILSVEGKKILLLDKNDYYGGLSASLHPLQYLFDLFNIEFVDDFGKSRDWHVDLIPKFILAGGNFIKLLTHCGVLRYLKFNQIEGSFVFHEDGIHKVPSSDSEALSSNLMDIFEKRRFRNFLIWAMDVKIEDPSTWNSVFTSEKDLSSSSILTAFSYFQLQQDTQSFIGHAICLYPNDSYFEVGRAADVIERIQLYSRSLSLYGKSPYIYPLYGLGELPQAFARLSAVYGGTFMLRKPVDNLVIENGRITGVKSEGQTVLCDAVISDPSYVQDLVKTTGKVIRATCLLKHPIPNLPDEASSMQIIMPQKATNCKQDIYISCISHTHKVCPAGYFIVIVAKTVETDDPRSELKPGLDLLGTIDKIFYKLDDLYEPLNDGKENRIFVTSSYDASTHFETTCADVLSMYERITGHVFDFSKVKDMLTTLGDE